jgi:hypothetical protein
MRWTAGRRCARPDCGGETVAALAYDYASSTVWLLDPLDPDPSRYDLCAQHADGLRVPSGWTLLDRRTAATPVLAVPAPAAS